ncbi:hypothetical protein BDV24DRAFT_107204 [Aspergillus arachidicola]|uniref:Uncharacterized protein n=1 Tax=Aspergillus arachidicola TaxID=656916 RepID=A0A5N6XXA8_9EURO|nr:hypothetical protein BDV24DRAFT_107204 [Aspergillus arachidicola]
MRLLAVASFVALSFCVTPTIAKCCPRTKWIPGYPKWCDGYSGEVTGAWCGKGPCNIFGCNCDGGCLGDD